MADLRNYSMHDFYCINCGSKGIPIFRKGSKMKEKGHRKLMYCPHCKHTVNHIECRSETDVKQFLSDYSEGMFSEEAKLELEYEKIHAKELLGHYGS